MVDYKLGDLVNIHNGTKYSHLQSGDIPLYGSGGIMSFVNDYLYDGEAILLPRKGTLTNIMYTSGKIWTVDTMYYATVKNNAVPYYLYSYLSTLDLQHLDSGSALPSMTKSSYDDLEIKLPDLDSQKKIATVLSTLDKKIALNNRINTELEAMAKTLYDFWFVQFDFPISEAQANALGKPELKGKPYKTSGGKMVFNEALKREIPAGWEVVELESLVKLINKSVLPGEVDIDTPYIGLEHIPRKKIVLSEWETAEKINSNKCLFEKNDILFGKIRPYFHKVGISFVNGITSTDTIVLRAKKNEYLGFSLEVVFTDEFVETATKSSTGSKMPRANWEVLRQYKIPIPATKDLLYKYQSLFDDMAKEMGLLVFQNIELTQLRDWLLPMLMNGQVTVKEPLNKS